MTDIFRFYVGSFLSTTIIIVIFLLIRWLFRKKSNVQICFIWIILLFRLLFPVSLETDWGVSDPVYEVVNHESRTIDIKSTTDNLNVDQENNELSNKNSNDRYVRKSECIWYIGIGIMGFYYIIQCILVYKKGRGARLLENYNNVREWKDSTGACVIGLLKPCIYLPNNLPDDIKKVIICHEQTHIQRRDYLVVFLYYIALMLNWYNPLAWIVYIVMLQDIECACDEQALRNATLNERKKYAYSLIQFYSGTYERDSFKYILGFSKKAIKKRVKDIGINKKKSKKITILILVCCCAILVTGACFYQLENYKEEMQQIGENIIGSDLPKFIYADDNYVEFYDYHGIYIYDIQNSNIYRYITFSEMGLVSQIQGENAIQVYAEQNGRKLYILSGKNQYVYDMGKNKIRQYDNAVIVTNMFHFEKNLEDEDNSIGGIYLYNDRKIYWSYVIGGTGLYKDLELNIEKGGKKTVYTIFK
ncbi:MULTISPECIES: M56 family metallopeptidase [Clostridia]|jgi:beta-lactamase regulating signal transducer with metallopeptidase domain|uniref:M56 family metallopeptidase n=1 Tax=Clostridia TaxID=186801 RepID=UPI00033726DF|nr:MULTISPECIES: M56 family metallopeptidase [unclassified Clostridium]RJX02684.1 hypothetical protein DWW43_01090 [Clostridium sp. AF15-41]CCY60358.1 peptidase M56 BlaR1 [Clostridium sp. CAG:264]